MEAREKKLQSSQSVDAEQKIEGREEDSDSVEEEEISFDISKYYKEAEEEEEDKTKACLELSSALAVRRGLMKWGKRGDVVGRYLERQLRPQSPE